MKKILTSLILIFSLTALYAESQIINFIKGNINEKTLAVREASGEDAKWLSNQAISFIIQNKSILGNDRDLEALAVAAIISITPEDVKSLSANDKDFLVEELIQLFNIFDDSNTVQVSIISKFIAIKENINIFPVVNLLNSYIENYNLENSNNSVIKSVLAALQVIGTEDSFKQVYKLWNDPKSKNISADLQNTLISLIPISMNEVLNIIHKDNIKELSNIFYLVFDLSLKNKEFSTNSLCEIAENVLNESIIIIDNSSKITSELISIQLDAIKILNENKWTRASSLALTFFNVAQKEYEAGLISEDDFSYVITSLLNLAPIYAVSPLTGYLEVLNNQKENNTEVSTVVVLSVINTLGAIGDKSAFDSLLATTLLFYPEEVLTAARNALSGLRW
ncbi:MAG: hypothetical protein K5866_04195 [Treponema sp.]|nr:hypothetical protein [Treponema sp.]